MKKNEWLRLGIVAALAVLGALAGERVLLESDCPEQTCPKCSAACVAPEPTPESP